MSSPGWPNWDTPVKGSTALSSLRSVPPPPSSASGENRDYHDDAAIQDRLPEMLGWGRTRSDGSPMKAQMRIPVRPFNLDAPQVQYMTQLGDGGHRHSGFKASGLRPYRYSLVACCGDCGNWARSHRCRETAPVSESMCAQTRRSD